MSKVKICGLTRLCDIEAVNIVQPDYVGFVFAKSKRQVDFSTACALKSALDQNIPSVGVFVNEEIDHIVKLYRNQIIDLIQLHGDEDKTYIEKLKEKVSVPIIKAIRVESADQVEKAYDLPCDYILFDTFTKNEYGGTGVAFNWDLVKDFKKPFFLAGGLSTGNVADAIQTVHPYCVDVSSGVETNGFKDREKMIEIVRQVRSVR